MDAEVLLAHCLQVDRIHLLAHPEQILTPDQLACFRTLAQRRANREPLAYLLGQRWFYALEFDVTPAVLIPRPETELLVEQALNWLDQRQGAAIRVIDVGTGSGAIAVSIAANTASDVQLLASDTSPKSLQVAKQNARKHGVEDRITFLQGDLLDPLPEPIHLILSNPPYIASDVIPTLMPEVRDHEPKAALDGGPDGLRIIERLLAQAPAFLSPGWSDLSWRSATIRARQPAILPKNSSLPPRFTSTKIWLDWIGWWNSKHRLIQRRGDRPVAPTHNNQKSGTPIL